MNVIDWLRDYLGNVALGLERFCNRYYGIYPGRVIDNKDPQGRFRIRATCPAINMPTADKVPGSFWMMPAMAGGGTTPDGQSMGEFWAPEEGTNVWVAFEAGDPNSPIYLGGFVTKKSTTDTFMQDDMEGKGPSKRGWRTKAGHFLRFDDDGDNLSITLSRGDGKGGSTSQFVSMTKEGHTQITNGSGSGVYLNGEKPESTVYTLNDKGDVASMLMLGDDNITLMTKSGGGISINGRDVVMTGKNVVADADAQFSANAGTVLLGKGASEPVIRGNRFALGWALIHQHTTTIPAVPTLPGPTPPPLLFNELSEKVFIS